MRLGAPTAISRCRRVGLPHVPAPRAEQQVSLNIVRQDPVASKSDGASGCTKKNQARELLTKIQVIALT